MSKPVESPPGSLQLEIPGEVIDRISPETAQLMEERRALDRRRWTRHSVHLMAYFRIEGMRERASCAVTDISVGGLFLRVDLAALPVGTRISVALELPFFDRHRICSMTGRVVRVLGGADGRTCGAGVEFDIAGASEDHETLVGFLRLWVGESEKSGRD